MTNLQTLGKVVAVKPVVEDMTSGGIFLSQAATERPQKGIVVTIGRGIQDPGFKVGDTILFPKYVGAEFKLNNEKLWLINEPDILAVFED